MSNLSRKDRTRYKLKKVSSRKRLSVFKSNNHIYAQIINDEKGETLASVSSLEKSFKDKVLISKGHATSALYPILRDYGIISKKDWDNWGKKKSNLRIISASNLADAATKIIEATK